jgi:hypothetical protein
VISLPEYNTLYVAVSKTASSSIRKRCSNLGVFKRAYEHVPNYISHKHLQHLNAQEYMRSLGEEDFEARWKFTIVKNPWARLVSHYLSMCRNHKNPILPKTGLHDPKIFQKWVREVAFNKEYFDNHLCPKFDDPTDRRYRGYEGNQVDGARCLHHRSTYDSQLSWISNKDGKLAVDFIGRFENINEDFRTILNKIHTIHPLPGDPEVDWALPWTNSAARGHHYSWYYNDEIVEMAREQYKVDIEEFGYDFETE